MLLPSCEKAARRTALPLHRGPHQDYNAMVINRVGDIEALWQIRRKSDCDAAGQDAIAELRLLQKTLRKQLLDEARPIRLNRKDPAGQGIDFSELDALADDLWAAAA